MKPQPPLEPGLGAAVPRGHSSLCEVTEDFRSELAAVSDPGVRAGCSRRIRRDWQRLLLDFCSLPDPGEARQGLIADGFQGTLCKGVCAGSLQESSALPVMPRVSHSTGPSELPDPAGVIGSLLRAPGFPPAPSFPTRGLDAEQGHPFNPDPELTVLCLAPLVVPLSIPGC